MGFAKYAEDNEEIIQERIQNRFHERRITSRTTDRKITGLETEIDVFARRGGPVMLRNCHEINCPFGRMI